jgi:hypothetical protein
LENTKENVIIAIHYTHCQTGGCHFIAYLVGEMVIKMFDDFIGAIKKE